MLVLAAWTLAWHAGFSVAPQETTGEVDAELRERLVAVVHELRRALRKQDHAAARECLDLGALLNAALELEPCPESSNLFWRWGVTSGWLQGLVDERESHAGELDVRSARRTGDPDDFEILTHVVDADRLDTYLLWRVRDREGQASIVDTLDLDDGNWASEWLASSIRLERSANLDVDLWLAVIEEVEVSLGFGLYEDAREHLESMTAGWPAPMAQTIETLHCGALLGQERWAAALARIEALAETNPRALLPLHLRAQALCGLGRFGEAQAVLETYERAVGGRDVTTLLYGARALAGQGKEAEARQALALGLDIDPNDSDLLFELALLTPRWDPEPLRARFLALDDPREAFEPLAIAFLDEGHYDAAEALCRIQRAADPTDPNAAYYLGRLHLALGQYESGARVLREVLPLAPAEEIEAYQELFLDACFGMGVALSGYERCPDRRAAFRYLAEGLLGADGPDGLLRAIEVHREREPDDPWLAYYEDGLVWHAGEHEEALRRFRAGMEAAGFFELREAYRSALVAAACEDGQARTIWKTVEPTDASFDQVLGAAFDARDLELFRDLLRDGKEARPQDPLRDFYRALRLHLEGQHERALKRLDRSHDAVEHHGTHVFRRDLAYVLSALHSGRVEDALRRALALQEEWDDDYLLLVVRVETGEDARALALVQRMLRRGWDPYGLYEDDFIGERLREDAAYDDLRAEYPPFVPEPTDGER